MVKVTLEEFICGPWLEEHGVFRAQLLQQLLVVNDVIEDWPRVLSACCGESRCHEAILEAVKKGCTGAEKWAEAHTQEPSLLLSFRLRLAVQSQSRPPPALLAEAEAALLRGEMLAPEALSSLDARSLWPRLVEQGALLPAAALLNCSGTESFEESEQVTSLIASNLLGPSAHARAALALLTALRPLSPPELLAALLQRQALHLLESLPLPDEDLQFAAAQLALRHGDRRVAGSVLRRLEKSRWMPEVVQAAAREEPWTQTWWAQEAANETNGSLEQLGVLMNARPWSSHHTLADLLRGWLAASSAQARYGGDADAAARAANAALRQLRLELPELPELVRSVAESFAALQKEAAEQCPLLLEMAACGLEVPGLEELLKRCRRTELKELVTADGLSTHQRQRRAAGLGRDAATALWAVKHLGAEVELQDGGFELVFSGQRCGYISWNDARKACLEDLSVAASYPTQDPEYATFRPTLLTLGPLAARHATGAELVRLAQASQSAAERLAVLEAIQAIAIEATTVVELRRILLEWAKNSEERSVVAAAVSCLGQLGGGSSEFLQLWPGLKKVKGALSAAAALLEDAPEEVLRSVFSSSSLCSSLAARLLRRPNASARPLALLAVHAAARDARHLAPDHPALQLIAARAAEVACPVREEGSVWPKGKAEVMEELLKLKDSLPVEGSPHGEAHGQQLRFWLCLGHLMSIKSHTVAAAAAAREALQRGALLPATRVVVQNVWAQAVVQGPKRLVLDLVEQLKDTEMPEAFATNSLAVAAQLLLHPDFALSEGNELEQLWSATIAWSASYVHQPRLLASLVLFHALEEQRIRTPGWYLEALHQQVRDASAFKKLRSKVKIEDWISDCWREVLKPTRPLDVQLAKACKQVAGDFWSPPDEDADEHVSGSHQRRPERPGNDQGDVVDIVVCASLVDNVPNMAGLVRTSEALLGRRVEVALRNEKVLQEASFQKMVVAADKSVRLSSVPCGPRLLAFLREHRSAGREVIALEQTSSSEMLQAELRLPQRFVLLLGSEQEGLPAWLLQSGLVDRCIELPLRGQTGSLNVHVAAAMLLWHYRLQH